MISTNENPFSAKKFKWKPKVLCNSISQFTTLMTQKVCLKSWTIAGWIFYCRWWGGHGRCGAFKDTKTDTKELDLTNVAGIFIVLACGVLLACIACVVEIICIRYKKCKKKVCNRICPRLVIVFCFVWLCHFCDFREILCGMNFPVSIPHCLNF